MGGGGGVKAAQKPIQFNLNICQVGTELGKANWS